MSLDPQARAWLDRPELARLWDGMCARLQGNGLAVSGRWDLDDPDDDERAELGFLMGRPYPNGPVRINLVHLDRCLPLGLIETVRELRGPLTDRRADRAARRTERELLWETAHDGLRDIGLTQPWTEVWLTELRRGGSLARLAPAMAAKLLDQASSVLGHLTAAPANIGRHELAERITGTAHGLDDGTLLSRIVLRALALAHETPLPADARARRELWARAGAPTDGVSSTVLTFGLLPDGDDLTARTLRARSGTETHLTLRDLLHASWRFTTNVEVLVCENPRVVEAAADAGTSHPLVCTSGNPNTTVMSLLDILAAQNVKLFFRGDFDWPGIAMTDRLMRRYGARAWRMSAADYEQHVLTARDRGTPLQPLAGTPCEASWDPELGPAMQALGVIVEEESALDLLLTDLRGPGPTGSETSS